MTLESTHEQISVTFWAQQYLFHTHTLVSQSFPPIVLYNVPEPNGLSTCKSDAHDGKFKPHCFQREVDHHHQSSYLLHCVLNEAVEQWAR